MEGRFCRLEPLDPDRHAADLFEAYADDRDGRMWTYMTHGPIKDLPELSGWMRAPCLGDDPLVPAIVDGATGKATGLANILRVDTTHAEINVGGRAFTPPVQCTPGRTEYQKQGALEPFQH